jgi:hypothetical protein
MLMEAWKILAIVGVVGGVGYLVWQSNQPAEAVSKPSELNDPSFPSKDFTQVKGFTPEYQANAKSTFGMFV